MSEEIRNKIHNIDLLFEEIKKFPQTYGTILQDQINNGTLQFILRRKLNNLFKEGTVFKTHIPGTRFGKAIYYVMPKEYHIIIEGDRAGSNIYCCFKYEREAKFYIKLDIYWELLHDKWVEKKEKLLFEGRILKVV